MGSRSLIIVILALVIVILIVISLAWWCYEYHPQKMVAWWGGVVADLIFLQDQRPPSGIPSLFSSRYVRHPAVALFNNALVVHHNEILMEVQALMTKKKVKGRLWLKYCYHWRPEIEELPTLMKIANSYKEIPSLWVDIVPSGATSHHHLSSNPLIRTFGYSLSVSGRAGFDLGDRPDLKTAWQTAESFVWDGTLASRHWNEGDKPLLLVGATFRRQLDWFHDLGGEIIYNIIRYSRHVKESLPRLNEETDPF